MSTVQTSLLGRRLTFTKLPNEALSERAAIIVSVYREDGHSSVDVEFDDGTLYCGLSLNMFTLERES